MGSTTVFVTGASAGFGEAIARRFAADGARLVISARRAERITEFAKEVGGDVLPLTLDVRDRPRAAIPAQTRLQALYNRPQLAPPEPAPEPAEVSALADISAMDQVTYAANRDSIMGIKPASEFRGVDMPTGSTALTDDQVAALLPWRSLGTPPPAGRVLDSEHSRAAHYAAGHTSLAVPNRCANPNGA